MWPVKKVTSSERPRSAAISHTVSRFWRQAGLTMSGAGCQSSQRRKMRTTWRPSSLMTANSSRTSPASKSDHQYMALRRGQ